MQGYERQYLYRRLTFASLYPILTDYFRMSGGPPRKSLQTYRVSDGAATKTFNNFDDLRHSFDGYSDQFIGITGSDDSRFVVTCNSLGLVYNLEGSPAMIAEISANLDTALNLPESFPRAPVIFIGHGRKDDWKLLRDHLQYQQKFDVEFYESDSRAGKTIHSVLESMKARSGVAILVYTAEDKLEGGQLRPRPNVVHECGFFAAGLGEGRTIVLREAGVDIPTNQAGEQYIEYPSGSIQMIFGEVVASVRRLVPRV